MEEYRIKLKLQNLFIGIACMVICVCFGYYVSCSFLDLGVIAEEVVDGYAEIVGDLF